MKIAMRIQYIVLLLMLSPWVNAQLMQNLLIDTKAMSLGNAVTADPVGIMNIHFNPAGLTKLDGRQVQFSAMNAVLQTTHEFSLPSDYDGENSLLDISEDPVVGKKGKSSAAAYLPGIGILPLDTLPVLTLPTAGLSLNPEGSKFTFANAVYAPMAAGFYKEDDDPGRYQAKQVALQRFTYLSPSFGYKVNDEFSVGAGFLFSHQSVAVVQDLRAPNILIAVAEELQNAFGCFDDDGNITGNDPLVPLIALCGGNIGPYDSVGELSIAVEQSLSPSYNLGFLWEPNDWFAWGVGYQSEAVTKLAGHYELQYSSGFSGFFGKLQSTILGAIAGAIFQLPSGVSVEKGLVSTELIYPQHFRTGVKFNFLDGFNLNVDAGWTDYDKWESLSFQFDRPVGFLNAAKVLAPGLVTSTSLNQPMGYESVWSFAYGLGYQLNSRTQLRFGYEPRKSSIPEDARSIQAPLGFAELFSTGVGYQWDKDTVVDLSLSYMESSEEILADPEPDGPFPNSSNAINRNCLTCTVTNPYPGLNVKTSLKLGVLGFTFRTKF